MTSDTIDTHASINWGIDSEYGVLTDVLLGPPDNLQIEPVSAFSRRAIAEGKTIDRAKAKEQHAMMVAAYEAAGVSVHSVPVAPHLKQQIYARDPSVMTPYGAIITRMANPFRVEEGGPCEMFYESAGIPIWNRITDGTLEGGDFMVVEPGHALIGYSEDRTTIAAAEQVKAWFNAEGWEVFLASNDADNLHIDMVFSMLAEKLACVCIEATHPSLIDWLNDRQIRMIDVSKEDMLNVGCNVVSLGAERVLLPETNVALAEACRAEGLEVTPLDISAITPVGGGLHCMCQAIRRLPA